MLVEDDDVECAIAEKNVLAQAYAHPFLTKMVGCFQSPDRCVHFVCQTLPTFRVVIMMLTIHDIRTCLTRMAYSLSLSLSLSLTHTHAHTHTHTHTQTQTLTHTQAHTHTLTPTDSTT